MTDNIMTALPGSSDPEDPTFYMPPRPDGGLPFNFLDIGKQLGMAKALGVSDEDLAKAWGCALDELEVFRARWETYKLEAQ